MLFLAFLLVSCFFWLMLTLNRNYEADIDFDVVVNNVPEDAGFVYSGNNVVTMRVRDRGTALINYKVHNFSPIRIDYRELKNRRGRLVMPVVHLKKRIEQQLLSTTSMLMHYPDTLYYYNRQSTKRFPVKVNANILGARQYYVDGVYTIPDSVLVFASESLTDTLQFIYTDFFSKEELRDSITLEIPLQQPPGVKCVPSTVKVVAPVIPYAEKTFELPVKGAGFPLNMRLKTFPATVKVVMNVSVEKYDKVKAKDFEIVVNYSDIVNNVERVKLTLSKVPSYVRDVRIVPDEVEFLIDIDNYE